MEISSVLGQVFSMSVLPTTKRIIDYDDQLEWYFGELYQVYECQYQSISVALLQANRLYNIIVDALVRGKVCCPVTLHWN